MMNTQFYLRIEDDMIDRDNALMDEMGSILFRYE